MPITSPPDKPKPNPSAFWARRVNTLALLCLLGLLLPLLSHLLANSAGTLAWLIDLTSHWQWLFLLGLVVFAGLASWRDKRWAVLLLALPLPWLTASAPAPAGDPQAQVFAVASANVHLDSRNTEALAAWLAQEKPDVVVLLEVSPAYAQGLGTLRDYPFQHIVAQDSPLWHRRAVAPSVAEDRGDRRCPGDCQYRGAVAVARPADRDYRPAPDAAAFAAVSQRA